MIDQNLRLFLNTPLALGSLKLPNRLIQGPLAGYSAAPFRRLFSLFKPPAYCVSEMISAHDVVYKHRKEGRYLYRAVDENMLCYQIAGHDLALMSEAAAKLEALGADLIDINCGCPKAKIRKKGAGSALLDQPQHLFALVKAIRLAIKCPLTIKLRLQGDNRDIDIAKGLADAGADAIIIHGRRWIDDYDKPCDLQQIAHIKQALDIPVIANGDIIDDSSLANTLIQSGCDAFMISRAGTGKPWLFQDLLNGSTSVIDNEQRTMLFMMHLYGLAALESEHQALLQSKSLVRYYYRHQLDPLFLQHFYKLTCLKDIENTLIAL